MVAQSRHQLLETGRDWATLWPTWIQSLEAVGILGGGDARYLLGMSRCFFLISWPKFRNTSIKSHKKSSHLHQISSNFSRSSVRWLIFFDWEVEWNIAKASSRWLPAVEPNLGWFIFHHCRWSIWPPSGSGDKQLLGQGLYLVWDQIWDPVPSSAIDVANLDLRYLEISWDGSCFRETFFFLRHLVHKSVALNMVKSHLLSGRWPPVVQTSHTSGVSWNGMNGAFQYICDGPWRLDENMMRTWWEHDENWTYAHIFGILRWYPLRLLFTISGYMNVYDLYDMTSCRWVILRGYPHDDWETSKWDQPGTVATGTVWATTLEPADPVVSCGEKNRAGWRWCWVRNKTTLNVKGFDGFLFYYAMHFFPTLPDVLVKWI